VFATLALIALVAAATRFRAHRARTEMSSCGYPGAPRTLPLWFWSVFGHQSP
jgi:hypothetical protein